MVRDGDDSPLPRILQNFLRRDAVARRVLIDALITVAAVRISLWLLPFRMVLRAVESHIPHLHRSDGEADVILITSAVNTVARRIPGATCLTRSLAAKVLLARRGHQSTLHLGVALDGSVLSAHSWLESGGRAIIGAPEPGRFVTLVRVGEHATSFHSEER